MRMGAVDRPGSHHCGPPYGGEPEKLLKAALRAKPKEARCEAPAPLVRLGLHVAARRPCEAPRQREPEPGPLRARAVPVTVTPDAGLEDALPLGRAARPGRRPRRCS